MGVKEGEIQRTSLGKRKLAANQKMLSVCRDSGKRRYKYVKQQNIGLGLYLSSRLVVKGWEAVLGTTPQIKREAACFYRMLLI